MRSSSSRRSSASSPHGSGRGIDETNRAAEEAVGAGDVAGFVAGTYTEDAVIIRPGADRISGHAAIEEFWTAAGEQLGLTGIRLETEDVVQAGEDMAYEIRTGVLETAQGPWRPTTW